MPESRLRAESLVLDLVGAGQRVLDLASGTGQRARAMAAAGCSVVGVEADPKAAKEAAEHCEHVVVGDLDRLDLGVELEGRRFDVIVAVEALERLKEPAAVLEGLRPFLAPGGFLVVAVPNIAHGDQRLALLAGTFANRDDLRFFTRRSLLDVLAEAGFAPIHVDTVERGVDGNGALPDDASGPDVAAVADAVRDVRRQPDALVDRFVVVAHPGSEPLPGLVARLSREREVLRDRLHNGAWAAYLTLLKRCLLRDGFRQPQVPVDARQVGLPPEVENWLTMWLDGAGFALVHRRPPTDWPSDAETMVSPQRLDNLHACVEEVVRNGVEGDLIETGVWRGGSAILMRAVLRALDDRTRTVWLADSFAGLPKPDPDRFPADDGDTLWMAKELVVPLDEVKANFAKYGLLDEQVRFLPGWFEDTLPSAPIEKLAILRLDGDLYSSTTAALQALYPKLSVGGYAIIDDYGAIAACRAAVHDFRDANGITEPLRQTDDTEVFWRRERR